MGRIKIRELDDAENHDPDKDYVAIAQGSPVATRKIKVSDLAGGGANVHVGTNPQANPENGDMWFDDVNAELYVYVNSIEGWVQSNGQGSFTAPTPPPAPEGTIPGRIRNIYPGAGVSNYVPSGTWLVYINGWQNDSGGTDEDLQYQHTGRYTIAENQYLYFKAATNNLYWKITNSKTKPAASGSGWNTVSGSMDTWFHTGVGDSFGLANGFAIEILQPTGGKSFLLDKPTVLYQETGIAAWKHEYMGDDITTPQGTIKAGTTPGIPANATEVQVLGIVNRGSSLANGFLFKHASHTNYKRLLNEKMTDNALYPSTNTTWYPLDENGEIQWKFEGGTTRDEVTLLEIQGYRT